MTKQEVFNLLAQAIKHIDNNFCAEDIDDYLHHQLDLPFKYSIDSGISKAVMLIQGLSFVIKMPFFTIYNEDSFCDDHCAWSCNRSEVLDDYAIKRQEEENDKNYILTRAEIEKVLCAFKQDNPEPEYTDPIYRYPISGANDIDLNGEENALNEWDYCALETAIYRRAKEEGIEQYFAEEEYLGTIDNTPIYAQARCVPMSSVSYDYNSAEYKRKRTSANETCKNLGINCFNAIWIADFVDFYGEDELARLSEFLDRYEIGDLRDCNIGYLDDAPILFDYSGYRDW